MPDDTKIKKVSEIYSRFENERLILRDELAIDRTILANERTLLAYLRSSIALILAGVSIIHFSSRNWFLWIGVLCLPGGLVAGIIGIWRYIKMNNAISLIRKKT